MITKTRTELVDVDDFDEVEEFEMPLEKDYILNVNIDHELDIINDYAEKHGYKGFTVG